MIAHKIIIGDAREMHEVAKRSVHLVVTSPPYWQIKDYGAKNQIGFHDDYRQYINNLNLVWEECARVLHAGCRLCVNIGDQFARAAHYGRYKVIPIREEIVGFCEKQLGLDYMGAIIWQKVTTCNTSGGATIMGSFPFPRNGIIKIDYEFILIFKKPGKAPAPPSPEAKEAARLTTEEWNEYFYGHWNFPGVRQSASGGEHPAAFPLELPRRLIRMFTFPGETVLDPFLGTGTTSVAAHRLSRNSIGYEINPEFRDTIEKRINEPGELFDSNEPPEIEFIVRQERPTDFSKRIMRWTQVGEALDAAVHRLVEPEETSSTPRAGQTWRVASVPGPDRLEIEDGRVVRLAGTRTFRQRGAANEATSHLEQLVAGHRVSLEAVSSTAGKDGAIPAYVHLDNRLFVNAHMIRDGYLKCDPGEKHRHTKRFEQYESEARETRRGLWKT